jgi:hypothetical protein
LKERERERERERGGWKYQGMFLLPRHVKEKDIHNNLREREITWRGKVRVTVETRVV